MSVVVTNVTTICFVSRNLIPKAKEIVKQKLSVLLKEYYDNSFVKMACDYIKTSGMTQQEIEKLLEQIKSQKESDDT